LNRPRGGGALPWLAAALLLAAAPGAAQQEGASSHPGGRFEGEFGLWVREEEDSVRVGWITARPDSGWLRVSEAGRVLAELRTPPALAHSAALPSPRSRSLELEYGGSGADRHRTAIRLGRVRRAPSSVSRADSVWVLGDVHGEFDNLVQLLLNARVVDPGLRWTGGRSHLVLLGDVVDRGPDAVRTLWFLYGLERQAEAAGGRVHVLLGNHEIMVFSDDLRYVAPKEAELARLHGVAYSELLDPRYSTLGRWLASKPALLRIGRALFAHGGVTPRQLPYTLASFDDSLSKFLGERRFHERQSEPSPTEQQVQARRDDFFWGDQSVFWHREYALSDTLGESLGRVLRRFGSDLLVVGHTSRGGIQERYGGRLIAAHAAEPALEMLLLTRDGPRWRRLRFGLVGPGRPVAGLREDGRTSRLLPPRPHPSPPPWTRTEWNIRPR
jgi:hypothetical protein